MSRAVPFIGSETLRCIENHKFSGTQLWEFPELVKNLLLVKKAAALSNELPSLERESIVKACDKASELDFRSFFVVDVFQGGGGIAINQNINEVLSHLSSSKNVNLSQSTADVCATALRLTIRDGVDQLVDLLNQCSAILREKADSFRTVSSISRTCLQQGLPTNLGVLFQGYTALIARSNSELANSAERLEQVNLGGTVFGSGDGASEMYRKRVLVELENLYGKPIRRRQNLYDAAQNSDDLSAVAKSFRSLAEALIKINKDLRLLSSTEFSEVVIPAVIKGSSFFKKKNNPTVVETVLQAAFLVCGKTKTAEQCAEHSELHLNVFEPLMGIMILECISLFKYSLMHWKRNVLVLIEAKKRSDV